MFSSYTVFFSSEGGQRSSEGLDAPLKYAKLTSYCLSFPELCGEVGLQSSWHIACVCVKVLRRSKDKDRCILILFLLKYFCFLSLLSVQEAKLANFFFFFLPSIIIFSSRTLKLWSYTLLTWREECAPLNKLESVETQLNVCYWQYLGQGLLIPFAQQQNFI